MRNLLVLILCALAAPAETTRVWTVTSFDELAKGHGENVSLSGDGSLTLAPRTEELHEAPESYLWDLAVDSDGNVFAAAGPDARVLKIDADGHKSVFFEADAVEVHALAVAPDGTLYAATGPKGKVLAIDPSGRAAELYDPGAVYIWDLAFGPDGALYVATGDPGEVRRVTPSGEASVYYETGETHVRSLAFTPDGALVLGTDPGGLVVRVRDGEGFVLHQTSRKEVTAVAAGADGAIYAAGVGVRAPTPQPQQQAQQQQASGGQSAAGQALQPARPPSGVALQVQGGSSVVRIAPGDEPREVWESSSAIVHALGFDDAGELLIGTGDEGELYRWEGGRRWTRVLTSASRQVTAFARRPGGGVLFATSNIGKIVALGPEPAESGWYESEPFDAERYADWGRLDLDRAGAVQASLRTGNLERAGRGWSGWGEPEGSRFAQWRVELTAGDPIPRVDEVRVYYRPVNESPRITELEVTPPGFRFPPRRSTPGSIETLTLPPIGQSPTPSSRRSSSSPSSQTLSGAPGWRGVRWLAEDPNDDELHGKVEIRGLAETGWTELADELEESEHSWDSAAFPDGRYELRVTVSDAASNPAGEGLDASRISEPFLIDNAAPAISGLTAESAGDALRVRFQASDATSVIERAEASVDGGPWRTIEPTDGLFDASELEFDVRLEPGALVAVRVYDAAGNSTASKVAP